MGRRSLLAIAVAVACGLGPVRPLPAIAAPTGHPAYTDPANTDADFPFQGEYAGTVTHDGQPVPFGVQVIALGDGRFDVVGYPGGLPGDGWAPPDRIKGTGTRSGEGDAAVVKVEALDWGGNRRQGEIRAGSLVVLSDSGTEMARLPKVTRTSATLGQKPPEGAISIYDGMGTSTDTSRLTNGRVSPDGLLMEGVTTKDSFGDAVWHIEFRLPYQPKDRGQGRGNSGAYLLGSYETQMLDSFGLEGKDNECGGIYRVAAPAVNMCLPPLSWQTYDIVVTAPRFEGDRKVANARMTVRLNGTVIHDDVEVGGITNGGTLKQEAARGPLHLQNHGNPVRYRNIWVLPKS
ncbi:MAG: DUF1080 domain-containing protein [Planctomycetia bacterium]|nr:DUF1080 domain-containing protein [Planctomycetia bacterium]